MKTATPFSNDYALRRLCDRIAAQQVVPLLGSGLAVPLGYMAWTEYLREAAARHGAALQTLVNERISGGEYEVAADLIHSCAGGEMLRDLNEHYCCEHPALQQAAALYENPARLLADPTVPAAAVLPLLFSGPVVTSAFDPVAAVLYRAAGRPFVREVVAPEGGLINQLALHQHLLVRLHGCLQIPQSRVLLSAEYRACYLADQQVREQLRIDLNKPHPNLLRHLVSLRSLLFIGCGLGQDYTLEVVERVAEFLPDSHHFALLPQSGAVSHSLNRRLRSNNIEPIYYAEPTQQPHALTAVLQILARDLAARASRSASGGEAVAVSGPGAVRPEAPEAAARSGAAEKGPRPGGVDSAALDRSDLRRMIDQWLRTEDDLMAFLYDYFPRVGMQLAPRMTRKEKVNVLFTYEDNEIIYHKLLQACRPSSPQPRGMADAPPPEPRRESPPACGNDAANDAVNDAANDAANDEPPLPVSAEILIPVGVEQLDLIKLLKSVIKRGDDPELSRVLSSFAELLRGDDKHLQLSLAPDAVTLRAKPPLLSKQSGQREPEVTQPRRAGPASPRLLQYFPRREVSDGYTLSLEASPIVRLKLVAHGPEPAPTLVFAERAAQ